MTKVTINVDYRTKSCLDDVAAEIKNRGGAAIPVTMDHGVDQGTYIKYR